MSCENVARRGVVGLVVTLALLPGCQPAEEEAPPVAEAEAEPAEDAGPRAVDAVIAAERAFSAMAVEEGSKAAFLHFFHDSVVTYGPAPVVGRQAVADGPDLPPLEWWPEVAEASLDGDMGYTSGPYRATRPDGTHAWGHYHSMWGLQPDGEWRVLLDMGGPHGEVPIPEDVTVPVRPRPPGAPGTAAAASLLDVARECDEMRAGAPSSLRQCAWSDARIYRPGLAPMLGTGAAIAHLQSEGEVLESVTEGGRVAASGDLGFTWGTGSVADDAMSFARFWRRDGEGRWRIVVEVVSRYPAPAPG